ncbi:MAG: virus [Bacteroidota bacterium]|jgi:hypothetical protein
MENLFKGEGILYYYDKNVRDTQWLLLNADDSIIEYYAYLVKKRYWLEKFQKPKHGSHISAIRGEIIEDSLFHQHWKKYHGQVIEFYYSPKVENNGEHFWLPVYSKDLEQIRIELGLNPVPQFNFHLTIGRLREEDINIKYGY